jgi:hypothetical protein
MVPPVDEVSLNTLSIAMESFGNELAVAPDHIELLREIIHLFV